MHLKKFLNDIIFFIIDSIRPLIGPTCCCIYPITCRNFTKSIIKEKPFYIAIPLIILRILSCNPITKLILQIQYNKKNK
ncbi:membrane protein insertion efficiency factor YidD [Candidatus Dependentiae bacterium]|nr:membrane protein insertion efficiency factor YidD [Candidatus Dependentiae bacterium]